MCNLRYKIEQITEAYCYLAVSCAIPVATARMAARLISNEENLGARQVVDMVVCFEGFWFLSKASRFLACVRIPGPPCLRK